jgi:hypothetical protein
LDRILRVLRRAPTDEERVAVRQLTTNIRHDIEAVTKITGDLNRRRQRLNQTVQAIEDLTARIGQIDEALEAALGRNIEALREYTMAESEFRANRDKEGNEQAELDRLEAEGRSIESTLMNSIREREAAEKKRDEELSQLVKLLGELKTGEIGSFISNIVVTQAKDTAVKDIRTKVSGNDAQSGLWSYASAGNKKLNDEKEDFSGNSYGGIIGYNMHMGNRVTFVPFIRMNRTDVSQKGINESDQGSIDKIGLGMGFWLESNGFFMDSVMLGNRDKYNTSRTEIEEENNRTYETNGKFEGSSGVFETEIGYVIPLKKGLKVIPYVGFNVAYVHRENYKENGDESVVVEMDQMTYTRSSIESGISVTGDIRKKLSWNMRAGINCVVNGISGKAQGRRAFNVLDADVIQEVISKNIQDGRVAFEGEANIVLQLNRNINTSIGASVEKFEHSHNISGNIGLAVKIGRKKNFKSEIKTLKEVFSSVTKELEYRKEELDKKKKSLGF